MNFKKVLNISMGLFFLIVGLIGLLLPIFPTTPFIILASLFFAKGSEKFDNWLKNTKIYKNYAEDFVRERAMTRKRKTRILLLADFMIAIPFIILDNWYIRVGLLVLVAIKYYYFIFKIKTIK